MRRHRALVALIALAVVLTQFPAAAFAAVAGPTTGPAVIRSEGFETLPYGSDLVIEPALAGPPDATAYWGRITQRAYSGSYGLWCAGSVPGDPAATPWTTYAGLYPDFTYGVAAFSLPQLSDYYSSSLEYRYLMPSIGAADAESFNVMWGPDGSSWDTHPNRPVTGVWLAESWDLSAPANSQNLSRKAGVARFGFVDMVEGFLESPTTGEGPTIDDVVISGYKFGPVRSLAASDVSGNAHLTWAVPWRSTAAIAAEERPVAYRVWRSPDVAPYSWTELTSTRQTATTFDDPTPLTGTYRYAVQAWDPGTGTGYGVDTSTTVTLTAPVTYTLTYTAGAGGTISGTSPQTVDSGGSGTQVTAVPNTGYHFVDWSDASTANPRTDTGVAADVNVTANFAINTYTLAYAAGANGSISGTSPQTVNYNGSGTAVTAVPNTGYHFVNWSDTSTTNPRTDTGVVADKSVTANFAINTYTLTYTAGANGSISGTSPQTVNYNGSGTAVTAVPNTGYHFVNWSDASTANPRTDANVRASKSVTANFAADASSYTLTYTAGANGSISGTSPQTVSSGGSGSQVTAVPNTGYHFSSWSDGYPTPARTDTGVLANVNATANFAINTYTLTYAAGAGGTISGTSPQTVNYNASGSQVTAVPNTGYHFVSWSDGVTTAARTDTGVVANRSVTANFAINTYTLTYTAGVGGTISGTTAQTVNYNASGTQVTAVAVLGYHFVGWSDGSAVNPRTDTGVVANRSVTANFASDYVGPAQSTVTIAASAASARIGGVPILSGWITPNDAIGRLMVVYVRKPGKSYWTYSSNRVVYNRGGQAAWQYKYYFKPGMVKGVYVFKARLFEAPGLYAMSESPNTVSIQLR